MPGKPAPCNLAAQTPGDGVALPVSTQLAKIATFSHLGLVPEGLDMRSMQKLMLAAVVGLSFTGAALADGAPKAAGTADDTGVGDERIICKKHLETGSLVKRVKKCFTKAEWDLIAEREQVGFKKTMDALNTRSLAN
jgi:hypothetical protein